MLLQNGSISYDMKHTVSIYAIDPFSNYIGLSYKFHENTSDWVLTSNIYITIKFMICYKLICTILFRRS